ncbi:MAG: hypothetical protein IJF67_11645, partial [Clostridia bacterium]|nr:hypothetical protein [Clostridia bacterium]
HRRIIRHRPGIAASYAIGRASPHHTPSAGHRRIIRHRPGIAASYAVGRASPHHTPFCQIP